MKAILVTTLALVTVGCGTVSRNPLAPVPTGSNVIIAQDGHDNFTAYRLDDGATTTKFLLNMGDNVTLAWLDGKGLHYTRSHWDGHAWIDSLYYWNDKTPTRPLGAPVPPVLRGVPGPDGAAYSTDENGVYRWRTVTDSVALRPTQTGAIENRGYWSVDAQIPGVVFAVGRDDIISRCDFNNRTVTTIGQGITGVMSVVQMPDGHFMQVSPSEGIWYNNTKLETPTGMEPIFVLRQQ